MARAVTVSVMDRPPRVWGRREVDGDLGQLAGQTPTRVGKTLTGRHSHCRGGTDPHACGEGPCSPAVLETGRAFFLLTLPELAAWWSRRLVGVVMGGSA